jgi:predicted RNA methylase
MYVEINEVIETLGGHWSRKDKCHIWNCNPGDKINSIVSPQTKTVTTTLETAKEKKKTFQFFATPPELADYVVKFSFLKENDIVLEPSAGDGALIKAMQRVYSDKHVYAYEIQPELQEQLKRISHVDLLGGDFLEVEPHVNFDKIIMNPPFSRNQDIKHIEHAYKFLKPGGRLVSICSGHWKHAGDKKSVAFRAWLETLDHNIEDIPSGTFKASGTMVSSKLLVIDK